jgi:hypothetical protein
MVVMRLERRRNGLVQKHPPALVGGQVPVSPGWRQRQQPRRWQISENLELDVVGSRFAF